MFRDFIEVGGGLLNMLCMSRELLHFVQSVRTAFYPPYPPKGGEGGVNGFVPRIRDYLATRLTDRDLWSAKIIKKGLVAQAFNSFSISNFFICRKAFVTLSDLERSFISS